MFDVSQNERNGMYRMTKNFGQRKAKNPMRRLDCFDCEESRDSLSNDDIILNKIAQKIRLLSLQVSRIENRLSAYETQKNNDFGQPLELCDPPEYLYKNKSIPKS